MKSEAVQMIIAGEEGLDAWASDRIVRQGSKVTLVSYTLPWHDVSLIDFLRSGAGSPRVYWEDDAWPLGFVGYGVAAVLMAGSPNRFQAIREGMDRLFDNAILETVDAPPIVGPRLFGGFSFQAEHQPRDIWSAFPAAYFMLPRYQLTRTGDRCWLTVNRLVGEQQSRNGRPRTTLSLAPDPPAAVHDSSPGMHDLPFAIRNSMDEPTWRSLVQSAVKRIRSGELDKVVLARTCDVWTHRPVDLVAVLARLQQRYLGCYRFLIEPVPGHAFFGATPELLVEVAGQHLRTVAMAGSAARGDTSDADAALARELMTSPKEREEHAFVVDAIEASLRSLAQRLDVPAQPAVRRLPNIQHLETVIHAELAKGCGILSAVEALHPTPAVGGVPRGPALRMITQSESVPRGWYASPVGWMDPQGNGLFSVAIRSAVSVGRRARLYAGAGIVADSEPAREWEETGLKFQPMLEALGATFAAS